MKSAGIAGLGLHSINKSYITQGWRKVASRTVTKIMVAKGTVMRISMIERRLRVYNTILAVFDI